MKRDIYLGLLIAGSLFGCPKENPSPDPGNTSYRDTQGRPLGLSFGAVPIDNYCESSAQLSCYRLQACRPTNLRSLYNTVAGCESELEEKCHGAFIETTTNFLVDQGQIIYHPSRMGSALTNHSRQHCNSSKIAPTPFSAIDPNLTLSQPCNRSAFCRSGHCTRNNSGRCGVCADPPAPLPSSCPEQCPLGQRCDCTSTDGGIQCQCEPALPAYADCSENKDGCDDGTRCIDGRSPSGDKKSACVPFPGRGEACGLSVGFLDCLGEQFCQTEICRSPVLVGVGETCNTRDRLCPSGYDCRGTCVPRASYDEICISRTQTTIPDAGPPSCREGVCLNRCRGIAEFGDFCRDGLDCQVDFGCYTFQTGNRVCTTEAAVKQELRDIFVCP